MNPAVSIPWAMHSPKRVFAAYSASRCSGAADLREERDILCRDRFLEFGPVTHLHAKNAVHCPTSFALNSTTACLLEATAPQPTIHNSQLESCATIPA